MTTYTVSTSVIVTVIFKSESGVLTNPNTVKAQIRSPDGTITEFESGDLNHPSVGQYEIMFAPIMNGLHQYRFAAYNADETPVASAEGYFTAQSEFIGQGAP